MDTRVKVRGVNRIATKQQVQAAFSIIERLRSADAVSLLKELGTPAPKGRPKGTYRYQTDEIVSLRMKGMTHAKIAAELGCSSRTVIRKLKGGEQ